jgi:uncharacterized lipoprotein NlpE involved in copper resistance
MKRKVFIFVLMVVFVMSGLVSCNKTKETKGTADVQNSRVSLDWAGVYTGTIPAADVSGINVRMQINKDNTYELTYEYLDIFDNNTFTFTGSFKWDNAGNVIILEIADAPSYYKVAENKLIQLDMEGNQITGDLADYYVLMKE